MLFHVYRLENLCCWDNYSTLLLNAVLIKILRTFPTEIGNSTNIYMETEKIKTSYKNLGGGRMRHHYIQPQYTLWNYCNQTICYYYLIYTYKWRKQKNLKLIYNYVVKFLTKTPRISSRVKMVYIVNAQSQNDKGKSNQKLQRWWNMSGFSALVRFRQAQYLELHSEILLQKQQWHKALIYVIWFQLERLLSRKQK